MRESRARRHGGGEESPRRKLASRRDTDCKFSHDKPLFHDPDSRLFKAAQHDVFSAAQDIESLERNIAQAKAAAIANATAVTSRLQDLEFGCDVYLR